jgi:hypothetical protein
VITGFHAGIDRCIRDRTWSLILRPAGQPDELYHLPEDPKEQTNVIDTHHAEAARLAGAYGHSFFHQQGRSARLKGLQGEYETASGSVD